jgi:hypothetical protein
MGWSISQLIDRFAQVGVSVSLETHECSDLGRTDDDDGSKSSVR